MRSGSRPGRGNCAPAGCSAKSRAGGSSSRSATSTRRPKRCSGRTMRIRRDRPTLLLVVHFWGGGVIHYARLLRERVASRVNVVFTWGVDDKTLHLSTRDPEISEQSFDLA